MHSIYELFGKNTHNFLISDNKKFTISQRLMSSQISRLQFLQDLNCTSTGYNCNRSVHDWKWKLLLLSLSVEVAFTTTKQCSHDY